MMRINRNIVANYASRLWAGLSTFIFVPAYLRILGPEAFGLITFSASILGIIFVVDMGMSNAFAREMAREADRMKLANLLRSLEWIYVGIVLLVLIAAISGAEWIDNNWLKTSRLAPGAVQLSVGLMLVSAVLQVMIALYIGALLGANQHVAAAGYQIAFGVVRSGLPLLPLYFWPAVEIVFVWQLGAALLFLALLRWRIWRTIDPPAKPHFSRSALAAISGFAGGMFGIALISAINTQSDKLVVSKIFSLDELGFYAVASLVGQIPSMLALPLAVTVLPRLTGHIARGERAEVSALYMRFSLMISIVAFTAAISIAIGAPPILTVILGSAPTPELIAVSRVLAAGGAFLAAQYMPYHLAVASGHTRTNIMFGAVSTILLPLAMLAGAKQIGLMGAAIPWMAMNAAAALLLAWRITPRFLGPYLAEWLWKANLLPFLVSMAVMLPAALALPLLDGPFTALSVLAVFFGAAMSINTLLFAHRLRSRPIASAIAMKASQ